MAKPNDKGKSFEREVAGIFNKRFKGYYNIEKPFMRNLEGSGSYFGGKNAHRGDSHFNPQTGDIKTPDDFKFTIECKNYKEAPSLAMIVKREVKQWDNWLAQTLQDAETSGKFPLLIIKYNYTPIIAISKEGIFNIEPLISYNKYRVYLLDELLKNSKTEDFINVR